VQKPRRHILATESSLTRAAAAAAAAVAATVDDNNAFDRLMTNHISDDEHTASQR